VRLSATPGEVKTPAPSLGQHSEEILRELNFTDDEITNFRRESVI
jgi:crotonobetainyl-CoA:carnitine CoA-transferase CaiB-like acyl-CoA transferase